MKKMTGRGRDDVGLLKFLERLFLPNVVRGFYTNGISYLIPV